MVPQRASQMGMGVFVVMVDSRSMGVAVGMHVFGNFFLGKLRGGFHDGNFFHRRRRRFFFHRG